MTMIVRALALGAAGVSLAACATVTRGSETAWEVNSTPPGAEVKTSHGFSCSSTPCAIKMPRKSTFTATLSKEGYKPAEVTVTNKISTGGGTAMAGNAIIGGVIGVVVDSNTGAMLDLTPNPVNVTLEPAATTTAAASTTTAQ